MAPSLRHPVGELPIVTLPLNTTPRRPVRSTLVSYEGVHGDLSFLLIRERAGPVPSGARIVLRGDFGAPARGRLASLLTTLPVDNLPLHFDLRRVTSLDEGCLGLLLKARRDQAPYRTVIFQSPEAGPIREMIGLHLHGLKKNWGLEKDLPRKSADVSPSLLPAQCLKTVPIQGGAVSSVQSVQQN